MADAIRRLRLVNFGPYTDVTVDLGDGLTIIRGQNLSGKTWLQLGVRWALLNDEWSYERLAHVQGEPAEASVTFDDGLQILRRRSASKNELQVTQPDGQVLNLSPGSGPNQTVMELTGIRPQQLSKRWSQILQFQGDHDTEFLLGERPADQEQALARVMGVDVLEAATGIIGSTLTSTTKEQNAVAGDVRVLDEELEAYTRVDELVEIVQQADRRLRELETEGAKLESESRTVDLFLVTKEQFENAFRQLANVEVPEYAGLAEGSQRLLTETRDVDNYCRLLMEHTALARISGVPVIAMPQAPPHLDLAESYCRLLEERVDGRLVEVCVQSSRNLERSIRVLVRTDEALQLLQQWCDTWEALQAANSEQQSATDELAVVEAQRQQLLRSMGVCPTCGQQILEKELEV